MSDEMKCPVTGVSGERPAGGPPANPTDPSSPQHGAVTSNSRKILRNFEWWPERLDLAVLAQNNKKVDPMGDDFDYAKEFESLDLSAVIADLHAVMTEARKPKASKPAPEIRSA